jgi:ABC-2 type transport system permease protein
VRHQHPNPLAGYRERGVLKRYRAASLGVSVIAGTELIVAFVLSAASSVVLLIAARLAYDFDSPASSLGVTAVFCYLTAGFTAIGLLLVCLVPTARAAQVRWAC